MGHVMGHVMMHVMGHVMMHVMGHVMMHVMGHVMGHVMMDVRDFRLTPSTWLCNTAAFWGGQIPVLVHALRSVSEPPMT